MKLSLACGTVVLVCFAALLQSSLGKNIAQGKPAMQSSTGWGGVASRAVDGNTNGAYEKKSCSHTNKKKVNWLSVDLGASYNIDAVTIFNRNAHRKRLVNFYVAASDDKKPKFKGDNHKPTNAQICHLQKEKFGAKLTVECGGKIKGRFVYLTSANHLTICEIEVTGKL
jgi:hypothetical protein